jgi:hypothetical protein
MAVVTDGIPDAERRDHQDDPAHRKYPSAPHQVSSHALPAL